MESVFTRHHNGWVILLTFFLAGFLALLPLPVWLESWRPAWLTLVLIYWVIALPHRVGLVSAWLAGFFLDVLEGGLLGVNALCLALVAWLALSLYQRLRMFTPLQQSATVMALTGIHAMLVFWVKTATGQNVAPDLRFLLPAVSSAILWPFVFVTLRYLRRSFQVS